MSLLREEILRIKSMMGIITESNITLPITIGKTWAAGKKDADLLHSFQTRKVDKKGALIGTQIEEKLKELYDAGINPDITDLDLIVDSTNYTVTWKATIDESKDGKAYMGTATRGSAGGGSDRRAEKQVEPLKQKLKREGAEDITLFLDFKNPSGIPIRQYFFKYTLPEKYPPHESDSSNYVKTEKPSTEIETPIVSSGGGSEPENKNTEDKFKSWESGIYKINGDKSWTYHLTDDKQWEAKKDNGSFVNIKDKLSPENYTLALKTLESAKKQ
jgi:hypothetical protein